MESKNLTLEEKSYASNLESDAELIKGGLR